MLEKVRHAGGRMYYSSPFKHQERGREDKGKHGKLTKEEEAESISGMLNNFSKALGEYKSSSIFYFTVNLQRLSKMYKSDRLKTSQLEQHPIFDLYPAQGISDRIFFLQIVEGLITFSGVG